MLWHFEVSPELFRTVVMWSAPKSSALPFIFSVHLSEQRCLFSLSKKYIHLLHLQSLYNLIEAADTVRGPSQYSLNACAISQHVIN